MRQTRVTWAIARVLLANLARLRQFRLLRFRLLTFGLYEPSACSGRRVGAHLAWWRVNPRVAWLLLRHTSAYGRWLAEMEATAQRGALGWWEHAAGPEEAQRLKQWLDEQNAPPSPD